MYAMNRLMNILWLLHKTEKVFDPILLNVTKTTFYQKNISLFACRHDTVYHSPYVSFSSCQRNLIKTFQIEAIIVLITKMAMIFS